ncbi:DUF3883 domain-containing protein [Rhodococcoides fascians]|uniref:DUF3883 domain-containing protein n=1 Tax=Rhodococcoides fascians TaxID=1828 RepID=UPI003899E210
MSILSAVRTELLAEAASSPHMLADLAGLEHYISESYSSRSFIELLQNADDAGAKRLHFSLGDDWVAIANDGRPFSEDDFRSLCRSASSKKQRGKGIGYRGIGFKSVVGLSSKVHLFSHDLQTTFSRELTVDEIGLDIPVPLVRIPHPVGIKTGSPASSKAQQLISDGYQTVFILEGLDRPQAMDEFDRFGADYLIFLNSIEFVEIHHTSTEIFTCERSQTLDNVINTRTVSNTTNDEWQILHTDLVSLAFSMSDDLVSPLRPDQGVIHAFLPTLEQSGFNIRINADFSTDPSRTRVVLDDTTEKLIGSAADIISELISENLATHSLPKSKAFLECLTPNIDETVIQLQNRSVRSELYTAVRERLTLTSNLVALAPTWLNGTDARNLRKASRGIVVAQVDEQASSALIRLSRFVGSETISVSEVFDAAKKGELSPIGRADVIAYVANSVVTHDVTIIDAAEAEIWESDSGTTNIQQISDSSSAVSLQFENLLTQRGVDIPYLIRRISKTGDLPIFSVNDQSPIATPSPKAPGPNENQIQPRTTENESPVVHPLGSSELIAQGRPSVRVPTASNSSKWRSAELSVLELLNSLGYSALDHSRQNLGYDLIAKRGSITLHVEVKSISYPGQPFSLTPNEDSFARDSPESFIIALVYRAKDATHIQFIKDPRSSLEFVKQCRQWAWECSTYKFVPHYELIQN